MDSRFSEAVYQALIANAPDGILLIDREGKIVLVNEQACELFAYSEDELLGITVDLLVPTDQRSGHVALREAFQKEPRIRPMGIGQELTGLRSDGGEFPVEISLASTGDADDRLSIAVVRDVTERREIEEDRADLIAAVQRQLERDRIARDLHDDIIQSVYAAGLSLQTAGGNESFSREDLIRRVVTDLNGIISDIRAYMRELTTDRREPNPAGVLAARIEELVVGDGPPYWTVSVSLAHPMDAEMGSQVHRVAKELVSNVQRHSQARNASISLSHDQQIELVVEDDGIGFDPAHTREGAFGLRSLQERVSELGGKISIVAREPSGTRVSVSIPTPKTAQVEQQSG